MNERKTERVKQLSVQIEFLFFYTVHGVANDRVTEMLCVHAYLVRSARPQIETAQSPVGKPAPPLPRRPEALIAEDKSELAANLCNALLPPAELIAPQIREAVGQLESFGPLAVNMTGSGSGVYALFENAEYCAYAKSRYRGKFAAYALKTH